MQIVKREIGSEFWDIPLAEHKNSLFPDETKWFLSGRIALKYIIEEALPFSSVALPRWCCHTMIDPFLEKGIKVIFYEDIPSSDTDAILLMDYFGYNTHSSVPDNYKGIVIRDITHSIFTRCFEDADYYYGSLRKWAGFWTGGFAYKKTNWTKKIHINNADEKYIALRRSAMEKKERYIFGLSDSKDYLDIFSKAEDYLSTISICTASPRDVFCAKHIDISFLQNRRKKNASILYENLKRIKYIYPKDENACPLFVPIIIENNRDEVKRRLIDHEIYCPSHWPNSDLAGKELSLICDQRYSEEGMKRMCEVLNACSL